MLPLMGGLMVKDAGSTATMWIAACMIVPTVVVAALSPLAGRKAQGWGRRPLLILCFAALILRGLIFATTSDPYFVVAAQALDGISAAVLAVLFPLIIADITCETGRFNLALGIVGSAMGIGAAMSTTIAGYAFDNFGAGFSFLGLAAIAAVGLIVVLLLMPETRPKTG
jgi:MFS family permease